MTALPNHLIRIRSNRILHSPLSQKIHRILRNLRILRKSQKWAINFCSKSYEIFNYLLLFLSIHQILLLILSTHRIPRNHLTLSILQILLLNQSIHQILHNHLILNILQILLLNQSIRQILHNYLILNILQILLLLWFQPRRWFLKNLC